MGAGSSITTVRRVLRGELGWIWPVFLLGCVVRQRVLLARTRWAAPGVPRAEARYAGRLALASAVYLSLSARLGQRRAYAVMRHLLLPIGIALPRGVLARMTVSATTSPMERLMAFQRRMQQSEGGRFNTRVYDTCDATTCAYRITRCVVVEVFTATRTPELARLICDVDRVFFAEAFPEFGFSRGDSWENTIAYGKPHCTFTLALRTPEASEQSPLG
ncbi:MAG: L-2-amino-thiazoline-4-carboxylic acid hydrolase [Chloroflexales bacterium]|nr:L-2-amino-thiazoline-4-carboxylic acid hydrolase [Chloroflexales bacterium]